MVLYCLCDKICLMMLHYQKYIDSFHVKRIEKINFKILIADFISILLLLLLFDTPN